MRTDYPHDGVIPMDDPFWQTLERDQTNEDQFRMTGTADEYEAYLAEADKQDRFDYDGMHSKSVEEQDAWLVANGFYQPGELLGYIPGSPEDPWFTPPEEFWEEVWAEQDALAEEMWNAAVLQAQQAAEFLL